MSDDDRNALIALAHCVEPGDAAIGRLVASVGAPEALERIKRPAPQAQHYEGPRRRLAAAAYGRAADVAASVGARIITRADAEWPTQLGDLAEQTPYALWVVGAANLRLLALRSIAIVGARACTTYGEEVARDWAADLTAEGWCVTSGGAFGVDAAAHRGALSVGGPTMCVAAGGVDVPYPRAHDALLARIADEGLLVSESPPGEAVRRQRFLSRNRVIAALTRVTIVVEAAARSGTIATARAASAMNRPVLAVPGPVTSPASVGCHRMIGDGDAVLVASAADVLGFLDLTRTERGEGVSTARDRLSPSERRILDSMPTRSSIGPDALASASALPLAAVWAGLGSLEAGGWVKQLSTGWKLARLPGPPGAG